MLPRTRSPMMPDLFAGYTLMPPSPGNSFNNFILPGTPLNNGSADFYRPQPPPQASSSASIPPKSTPGPSSSASSAGAGGPKVTNEYTKFTLAKKAPEYALHTEMDRLPARVKRLFENLENLQVAHVAYNSLPSTEVREKFLLDQVIRRQIVSLEISLSEGLIHFAMDVIDTMFEAAHFIRSLFYEDFYNPDGSHTILPIILNDESDDYINRLAPVVYSLNRISGSRRRSDNSGMTVETVCTKLQLEMISLTICPTKSLMFRSILEVVPSTAVRARAMLEEVENKAAIKWINNSTMRKDYTKILINFKLIDKTDIVTKFPSVKNKGNNKLHPKTCPEDPGNASHGSKKGGKNIHTSSSTVLTNPTAMGDINNSSSSSIFPQAL